MSEEMRGLSVLVVHPNSQVRRMIGSMLTGVGITSVFDATNVDDALHRVSASRPGIVMIDAETPGALEMVKQVRADYPKGTLKLVVVSMRADRATVLAAAHAGADDFLRAPFAHDVLIRRVIPKASVPVDTHPQQDVVAI